jgi:diguanylate cyclase (GGDEF)-like protein/PAS domain S-box-containing protein
VGLPVAADRDVGPASRLPDWEGEATRLAKIVRVLMDRAERSTSQADSAFSLFQTTVVLEERVRRRTAELEGALLENKRMTRSLGESEAKFRGLVSQSLVGIVIIQDGKFSYSNARFDEIFGYSAEEVHGLGPLDMAIEADRQMVADKLLLQLANKAEHGDYVFRGRRRDGKQIDIECHASDMDVGEKLLLVSLFIDITERTQAQRAVHLLQEQLREESTHDALTGLYNRRYLEESLGRVLALAEGNGHPVSVILADIDHFKSVNDRYGHLAGDEVLRACGAVMMSRVRGSDFSCRYGGEEFLLVMPKMTSAQAVERAEKLRTALAAVPIKHGEDDIRVTASFGVATFPADGRTVDELVGTADHALYAAKAAGRDRVHFNCTGKEGTTDDHKPDVTLGGAAHTEAAVDAAGDEQIGQQPGS